MATSWDRPKRTWGWSRSGVWWVLLVLFVAAIVVPFSRRALQRLVSSVGRPVVFVVQQSQAEPGDEVQATLIGLQQRLASLVVDGARLQALEEENRLLRQQAHVSLQAGFEGLGAQVISRAMTPDRASIVIDRGELDRVEIGQAVLAGDGFLVGKVSAIGSRTATVELVTDPSSRVAATLSGEQRVLGVVEGRGNGAARMTYIPSSQVIKKDQIITTSGTEEKIPAHIPLGLVNAVEGKNTDPFVSAILEPLLPLDRLTFVTVLRPQIAEAAVH